MFNDNHWTRKGRSLVWNVRLQTGRKMEQRCQCYDWGHSRKWTPDIARYQWRSTEGILKKRGGISTIHFTAESWNIEILFRSTHSANQLSNHGVVSSCCEDWAEKIPGWSSSPVNRSVSRVNDQLLNKLIPHEVDSLVRNPTRTEGTAGHSLHDRLRRFKWLDPED